MSDWTFGLWGLNGTRIAPVTRGFERGVTLPLNGLPTAKLRTSLDDATSDLILDRDGDVLLTIHQGTTVRFVGELMLAEEVTRAQENKPPSLMCTFAGPLFRLTRRLIGTPYPSQPLLPSGWVNLPADQIIKAILDQVNADDTAVSPTIERDTGIRWGTSPTLYKTTVGIDPSWLLKPASEGLTDLRESKVPFPVHVPPAYVLRDNFAAAGSGVVHGRTPNVGNAASWVSGGAGPDWGTAGVYATRYDTNSAGRWAVNTTPLPTNCLYGVDHHSSHRSGYQTPFYLNFMLYARLNGHTASSLDSGQWLKLSVNFDGFNGSYTLQKKVGGVITNIGQYNIQYTWLQDYWWYAARILVDDLGNYAVWDWELSSLSADSFTGATPRPLFTGRDADLAAGGPLADGVMAFGDLNISGVGVSRTFDNAFASEYTGPQSFDFELIPNEPTVDASGVKIATLSLASQIGVDRPNAIFEYGEGSRSAKDYVRRIDRQALINRAYSMNNSVTPVDVRSAHDPTSIAARGEYAELIPSDFGDAQLRQALIEAHVRYRKVPRKIVEFTPSGRGPVFGVDYNVGDFVRGRSVRAGKVRFNGVFRVFSVDVSIDELGRVSVAPVLVPT